MQKIVKSRLKTIGLPPGSLVHIGDKKRDTTVITRIEYGEDTCNQSNISSKDLSEIKQSEGKAIWLNIEGLNETEVLAQIGDKFGLHPLVMEDILNTDQRPKIEFSQDYMYICAKMLNYDKKLGEFDIEQISLVLGKNFVISFCEKDTDIFAPVIKRLSLSAGRIRKLGTDYLMYCLLDIIVDNYFTVLEDFSEEIEVAEDELIVQSTSKTLKTIHKLKRQVLFLHKAVWPLRDVLSSLERGESELINESTNIFIRDLYDHVVQAMDTTETIRDILSSMLDIYLSSTSNRMNEIMKVLTIISTVFMPLSFIVGIYGMNIRNMPELGWPYMYPVLWGVMIAIVAFMLYYFKKKKWW
ncbi:magnesium and cobalt transport protein CorA [Ruminiclostridium papyrosolvens DSM 2782]|uniref:Magnesium transport protein CorA n=1 Tax=Ruminiclostridium papyrosolvens DSM 2782 TaxID=588581 RepID=F1T7N4_9FIRM|nr:magnesium/cobalt transporter CorA [Ruminiclostridium papyrosolvens]EGD49482.1 magnesium and cobalt transport protein CorA [Ruminiclostridium papyrosolvens DSM 2782]WES33393.1 magnesium/cobalt transporter CorA [Ruminiclostridium papyrosolvens DSM 2782]